MLEKDDENFTSITPSKFMMRMINDMGIPLECLWFTNHLILLNFRIIPMKITYLN